MNNVWTAVHYITCNAELLSSARRSSFRLPSRGESRDRDYKLSQADTSYNHDGKNIAGIERTILKKQLDDLDPELEADPFVPKTDFFTYDATNSGNTIISNIHGENKTRHSQFSPLPAPPPSSGRAKHVSGIGSTVRHSQFSPLPKPRSLRFANDYVTGNSGSSEVESNYDDGYTAVNGPVIYGSRGDGIRRDIRRSKLSKNVENKNQVISQFPSNTNRHEGGMRHPTPSNVAFVHSRYWYY